MQKLFRVETWLPAPGFELTAGRRGNDLRSYSIGAMGDPWILASELILEQIRAADFPDRPSRWRSCFAFEDEKTARACLAQSPGSHLFEVEVVDQSARRFVADWDLLIGSKRLVTGTPFIPLQEHIARAYWGASGVASFPELVVESNLRVVGPVP